MPQGSQAGASEGRQAGRRGESLQQGGDACGAGVGSTEAVGRQREGASGGHQVWEGHSGEIGGVEAGREQGDMEVDVETGASAEFKERLQCRAWRSAGRMGARGEGVGQRFGVLEQGSGFWVSAGLGYQVQG